MSCKQYNGWNDWICRGCNFKIFGNKKMCTKCKLERDEIPKQGSEKVPFEAKFNIKDWQK